MIQNEEREKGTLKYLRATNQEGQGCRGGGRALKQTYTYLRILPICIYTAFLTPDIFINFDVSRGIAKQWEYSPNICVSLENQIEYCKMFPNYHIFTVYVCAY